LKEQYTFVFEAGTEEKGLTLFLVERKISIKGTNVICLENSEFFCVSREKNLTLGDVWDYTDRNSNFKIFK